MWLEPPTETPFVSDEREPSVARTQGTVDAGSIDEPEDAARRGFAAVRNGRGRERGLSMSPVALAWQQFRFERKMFWRNPSAAFFNFLLPLLLLVLTASAFSADSEELEILIPGI